MTRWRPQKIVKHLVMDFSLFFDKEIKSITFATLELRIRDVAQPGSALAWGARGRKFESCRPDRYGNQCLRIAGALSFQRGAAECIRALVRIFFIREICPRW